MQILRTADLRLTLDTQAAISGGDRRSGVSENWHEERDRLVLLIEAVENGDVTHIDQGQLRQLQETNPHNVAMLKSRLATLNARLSDGDKPPSAP